MKDHLIEWRFYVGHDFLGDTIGWFDHGLKLDHVDVVDPRTGWLWGAHASSMRVRDPQGRMVSIPSGFYARPPNYEKWSRVWAFRLAVTALQHQRFWEFTHRQEASPYDRRGLICTYVFGRDWRNPGKWYCSEEQAAAAEHAFIIRKLLDGVVSVDPEDFAEILNQAGALRQDLGPVPPLGIAA